MARFIIIDHSIQGQGGHYLEYANRVLNAAREQGFETLAAAHRNFAGREELSPHPVRPWFHRTYGENLDHWTFFLKRQAGYYRDWVFNLPGRAGRKLSRLSACAWNALFSGPLASRLVIGGRLWAWRQAWDFFWRRPSKGPARLLRMTAALGRGALLILFSPVLLGRLAWRLPRKYRGRPGFAADLDRLLAQPDFASAGDIIFIPTLARTELRALRRVLARRPPAREFRWRLLFRNELTVGRFWPQQGRRVDFWPVLERLRLFAPWRRDFWRLRKDFPDLDVRMFTDTEELTHDFGRLGVYPFHTAPIPVDPELIRPNPAPAAPLDVLYIGDLRDEKGATHLPHLIRETGDLIAAGRIRYRIQSNFNVPQGEPASRRAMEILQSEAAAGRVELINGPLSQSEYNRLLAGAGLVLIPYDRGQYQARSSGILAEALAVGSPLVAPSGTTMARLAEPGRQAHFRQLLSGAEVLEERRTPLGRFLDGEGESFILPDQAEGLYLAAELPAGPPEKMFMVLHVTKHGSQDVGEGRFWGNLRQTVALNPGEPALALLPLHPAPSLAATLLFPLTAVGLSRLTEVKLRLVRLTPPRPPRAAGLALFEDRADLIDAVRDLVEHYDHHRRAVEELAGRMRPQYAPAHLVETIVPEEPRRRLFRASKRIRILALTDIALGYGSPQVPALVESLSRHYDAEALILERDHPQQPPCRPDFLGPQVEIERLFTGGLPPGPDAAAYAAQAGEYLERLRPDLLVVSWLEAGALLRRQRHRPGLTILQALEMPGANTDVNAAEWSFDRIIFPEKHRAALTLPRLGLKADDPRQFIMPNSRLFSEPPAVLPAAGRRARVVFAGGLDDISNAHWLLDPVTRAQQFPIDVYGTGALSSRFRQEAPGYAGYVPTDAAFFAALGRYAFSLILWRGEREETYYAAPNKLYDALACGVPFISGPHPQAVELATEYGCGLITLDWTRDGFLAALRRAWDLFPTSAYAEMVEGCRRARAAADWETHFQKLAESLPAADELKGLRI